jgi:hypothetical protein
MKLSGGQFGLEKYLKDGHFERVLERTLERVGTEAKVFKSPPAELSKDGKQMLTRGHVKELN